MTESEWQEPVTGFQFSPEQVVVTEALQNEKLKNCGLDGQALKGHVDVSFYIAIGIHVGINNGISAEGNVNMLTGLIQHRPVRLGEPLIARGAITNVVDVPRGQTVETDVWFEDESGERVVSAPRKSLRPDPHKSAERGAGERPEAVIKDVSQLTSFESYTLTPELVKAYSSEGNSIHYEMESANKAGFRAPIIGGGMGVHYLINTLWQQREVMSFDLDIYFRRPIFWDDVFSVAGSPWKSIGLLREGKVLTEARINKIE